MKHGFIAAVTHAVFRGTIGHRYLSEPVSKHRYRAPGDGAAGGSRAMNQATLAIPARDDAGRVRGSRLAERADR